MSDGDRLLLAILAEPDRDDCRLVYADHLEEYGDGQGDALRAEFIRCQMELERLKLSWEAKFHAGTLPADHPIARRSRKGGGLSREALNRIVRHDEMVDALRRREGELLVGTDGQCCRCSWHAPLTHDSRKGLAGAWEYRRGFVSSITLTTDDFLQHAGAVFSVQPVVEVRLSDVYATVREYGGGDDRWTFWRHQFPAALWDALCDGHGEGHPFYETRKDRDGSARLLSGKMAAFGRAAAGLTP